MIKNEYRLYGKLHRGGSAWSGNRYWGIHWSHIYFRPNLKVLRGVVSYFFLHPYHNAHCLVGSRQWIFMNKVMNTPQKIFTSETCGNAFHHRAPVRTHSRVCVCVCVCVKWYNLFHKFCRHQPFGRFYVSYVTVLPENKGGGRQEVTYEVGYITVEKNEISFSHTI